MPIISRLGAEHRRCVRRLPASVCEEFLSSAWVSCLDREVPSLGTLGGWVDASADDLEVHVVDRLLRLPAPWWEGFAAHWKPEVADWGPFSQLALATYQSLRGFDRFQLTRSERKSKAERISSLAAQLAAEIEGFDGHYPFSFIDAGLAFRREYRELHQAKLRALYSETCRLFDRRVEPSANAWAGDRHSALEVGLQHESDGAGAAAMDLFLPHLPSLLGALESAAVTWGRSDQTIPQPRGANARRNFFLQVMTTFMVRATGRLMRTHVLELSSLFFDVDAIDEAYLSKVAPDPRPAKKAAE